MNEQEANEVLWKGRPKQGLVFRGYDLVLVPFVLWWGWEIPSMLQTAFLEGGDNGDKLFAVTMAGIGAYILIVRYFHDAWVRANTSYEITTEGVAFNYRGLIKKKVVIPFAEISMVSLSNYHSDTASVLLNGTDSLWALRESFPSFMLTDEVESGGVALRQVRGPGEIQALIKRQVRSGT
jgi:hypothetical protein